MSALACTLFQSSAVFGPPTCTPFSQTAASNTALDTGSTVVSMICSTVAIGCNAGPFEHAAAVTMRNPTTTDAPIRVGWVRWVGYVGSVSVSDLPGPPDTPGPTGQPVIR